MSPALELSRLVGLTPALWLQDVVHSTLCVCVYVCVVCANCDSKVPNESSHGKDEKLPMLRRDN